MFYFFICLLVSRSFGDIRVKAHGVTSIPEISKFSITSLDQFLLLGCDGLWNVFTPDEAVEFIRTNIEEQYAIQQSRESTEPLLTSIIRRVTQKLVRESVLVRGARDNVTVILIAFQHEIEQK
jgi:integrin-linked kinase-associated serine/threonine phosphatase 2C